MNPPFIYDILLNRVSMETGYTQYLVRIFFILFTEYEIRLLGHRFLRLTMFCLAYILSIHVFITYVRVFVSCVNFTSINRNPYFEYQIRVSSVLSNNFDATICTLNSKFTKWDPLQFQLYITKPVLFWFYKNVYIHFFVSSIKNHVLIINT